jgi:hypothetical protein
MKKFFAVPLAVLFVAACSDSTAPVTKSADITPSYAKPGSGGGIQPATGSKYTDLYDFNSVAILAADHSSYATDTDNSTVASSATEIQTVPVDPSNGFVGRYNNTNTRALLVLTTAGSKYTVDFDLYVIGSWDGKGKQAQNGNFEANVFQVGYRCGSGTSAVTPIFTTTFSNQLTVQQDFPSSFGLGGNKAATGSVPNSIDALGYRTAKDANGNYLSNTPTFRSFGDVTYHLSYTIANVCSGAAPTFVFSSTAPGQQSNYDESWGIDNLTLKVDN